MIFSLLRDDGRIQEPSLVNSLSPNIATGQVQPCAWSEATRGEGCQRHGKCTELFDVGVASKSSFGFASNVRFDGVL